MIATAEQLYVRHYQKSDRLPVEVWSDLTDDLNPHWVWVVEDADGKVCACLVTAAAHGLVILLRVWSNPQAPKMALRKLFRHAAAECLALGMTGWTTILSVTQPAELKLVKLALRYKGIPKPLTGYLVTGRLEHVCRGQQ